jgi:hypothetical protein
VKKSTAKLRPAGSAVTAKFPTDYGKLFTRCPPNNHELPFQTIQQMLGMLTAIRDEMENYSVRQKAKGFLARSLRYAQTPHINSWSFATAKLLSYPA